MKLPSLSELEDAACVAHAVVAPTPQICWPMLSERCAAEVWVKHENHLPTGAFKVRGGAVYAEDLARHAPAPTTVVAATRGNHGQSVAYAARRLGLKATIVVPLGNSASNNAAMCAYGAELVEHGHDFQAALEHARSLASDRGCHFFPSFHPLLVRGVASYAMELFAAVPDLDTVYVPIGLGSGICGVIAAREAMRRRTRIAGVVSQSAPAYALSFAARRPVATETADTIADGVACRVPEPDAVEVINRHAERIVAVSDDEVKRAMAYYFSDTHNVAEGAGAAPLAALLKERDSMRGKRIALILSGGNVDRELYRDVLSSQ
jgi:threonine dehydratase